MQALEIVRGMKGLNIVCADVVEVSIIIYIVLNCDPARQKGPYCEIFMLRNSLSKFRFFIGLLANKFLNKKPLREFEQNLYQNISVKKTTCYTMNSIFKFLTIILSYAGSHM